jgi:hypothetical protein
MWTKTSKNGLWTALACSAILSLAGNASAQSVPGGLGSRAAGSRAAPANAGPRAAAGTPATGSRAALGSLAAGSAAAGSKAARAPLGSRAAHVTLGSQAAPATLGSQAAPATLGSQAAGSRATPSPGTVAAGSPNGKRAMAPASRRAIVPPIEGRLPRLSTKSPGLLFVVADGSGSMDKPFAGHESIKKADAVADAVNNVLLEFIDRNNVGGEIKPRLDVIVAGYGATNGSLLSGRLAGRDIVSLSELADGVVGETAGQPGAEISRPVWIRPMASGNTPMRDAFGRLRRTVGSWSRRPQGSHLVFGVHVTDGAADAGQDPSAEIESLARDVSENGGQLLMTNVHLSSSGNDSQAVVFPNEEDAAKLDADGQRLFSLSSPVPQSLAATLKTKPGARMMAYNATIEQFAAIFEAGSSVAAQ